MARGRQRSPERLVIDAVLAANPNITWKDAKGEVQKRLPNISDELLNKLQGSFGVAKSILHNGKPESNGAPRVKTISMERIAEEILAVKEKYGTLDEVRVRLKNLKRAVETLKDVDSCPNAVKEIELLTATVAIMTVSHRQEVEVA